MSSLLDLFYFNNEVCYRLIGIHSIGIVKQSFVAVAGLNGIENWIIPRITFTFKAVKADDVKVGEKATVYVDPTSNAVKKVYVEPMKMASSSEKH